jgi:hypothetical protein
VDTKGGSATQTIQFMEVSQNKNAGLVGPALSLFIHLWGATGYVFVPADLAKLYVTACR